MMICQHLKPDRLDATDRLVHRAQLINLLEQQFPGFPADQIDEVLNSNDFEYAHCPDCDAFLVRLA